MENYPPSYFFFITETYKCSGLVAITGLPTSVGLKTVKFIDISTGWATGENGTILKTTNGGTLVLQTSGTTSIAPRSIFF
ncbi:MAG: hypothetical protein IPP15_23415 [Saprospiraceae bacterium]|uniref:Uncharacterized protein n=1 Tax=Candidatus Opimibacter skivensis TaxID=2982028 RepID=A0A9D7XSQ5_9BACT|nr:hypothetical protein [Candidatus Opimibacter skivensis]